MSDIPSTWPDNYVELQENQTPSHYERILWKDYLMLSRFSIWTREIVYDAKKNVFSILELSETKRETDILREDFEQEFIKKLKEKTANQYILDAIEKWTFKVLEIPWKEKMALSLNWNNIDYIFNLDWTEFFDFKWRRDNPAKYSMFLGLSHWNFIEIEKWNWVYKLVTNWNELEPLSKKSITEYHKWSIYMNKTIKTLEWVYDNWDNL
jgi:hypothetical protein